MKKVLSAILAMFILIVPFGGLWTVIFQPIVGGGVDLSPIFPIYAGLILLAGVVVGSAVILYDEIKALRKELNELKKAEMDARDTEQD
ncbi:MAG: hypothetical protein ACI4EG_03215 [Fusicatenibacter sp.]